MTHHLKVSGSRRAVKLQYVAENMRREGFECSTCSCHTVVIKEERGVRLEPFEYLVIDVPEEFQGTVIEKLGKREGRNDDHSHQCLMEQFDLEFEIPARG